MTNQTERSFVPVQGKRLRIFVGEAQEWQGRSLYRAILEVAQQQGVAGATALRGIEGFGPEHHLSSERLPDISVNLPIIIEIVDRAERIDVLLPVLDQMVQRGMISLTPVEIVYSGEAR
jgi:PII-like signaling protein